MAVSQDEKEKRDAGKLPPEWDQEFAEACRENQRVWKKHGGNFGCVASIVAGFVLAILGAIWADNAFIGIMLITYLPLLLGLGYYSLMHRLFFKKPGERVDRLIEEYIEERMEWRDCPEFVMLSTHGLPLGSSVTKRIDVKTGRFCLVAKPFLRWILEDSARHRLAETATIVNGMIPENRQRELLELLEQVPLDGALKLACTIHDGLPFRLEIVRNGRKRLCEGNLADIPKDVEEIPELRLIGMLGGISDGKQPDHRGVASCDSKGNITIYS